MFTEKDDQGNHVRNRVVVDCSNDEIITEQNHKDEVNINNIVKRHGLDLIRKTANMQELVFDDVTGNDFQEAMILLNKAQESFQHVPSELRKQFNNSPAEFLDFIQNPDNADQLVDMGLAKKPQVQEPVQVAVVNQPDNDANETPDTVV